MRVSRGGFTTRAKRLAALACLVLTGCGIGSLDDFAPLTVFDNFRVIEEGRAYRSAQLDAQTLRLVIQTYDIRTVVNLRGTNESEPWYQRERAVTEETGVTLVDIRMSAGALPAREQLLLLYDTFTTAEQPILIHCKGGADRTGAAAAIWRMVVRGEPREVAAQELSLAYGHFPTVNPEMDQLVAIFEPDRAWIENEYPVP